jgi:hypothetical protein
VIDPSIVRADGGRSLSQADAARRLGRGAGTLPREHGPADGVAAFDLCYRFRLQRQPVEPAVCLGDVAGSKADARQPLALRGKHRTNTIRIRALAVRRHQFQRGVIEREQDAIGTMVAVLPGRRARKQRLVGRGRRMNVAGKNDDVIEADDHGNRPRVFLAARTFSTPIAIAAVRCGILSALARCTM